MNWFSCLLGVLMGSIIYLIARLVALKFGWDWFKEKVMATDMSTEYWEFYSNGETIIVWAILDKKGKLHIYCEVKCSL